MALEVNPNNLYLSFLALSNSIYLRSNKWNPTKYRVSDNSKVLIYLSIGLELLSEGHTFTSRSQGLSFESSRISNPNTSKHALLFLPPPIAVTILDSTEITVFIRTSWMLANVVS